VSEPAVTGFFGKLPTAGDFVARGLAPGVRQVLDRFLSAALAEAAREPEAWPEGGIVAVIEGPGGAADPVVSLILPSGDSAGRAFPIAAVAPLGGAGPWANAVFRPLVDAADGMIVARTLGEALAARPLPAPVAGEPPLAPPLLWAEGAPPGPPEAALPRLIGAAQL